MQVLWFSTVINYNVIDLINVVKLMHFLKIVLIYLLYSHLFYKWVSL